MSADIGKGDVVAAAIDHPARRPFQCYAVNAGARATVVSIETTNAPCFGCGDVGPGLVLDPYDLPDGVLWCPCSWRKVGGSESDTVAMFARHLTTAPKPRERVDATGDALAAGMDIFRRAIAALGFAVSPIKFDWLRRG